MRLIFKYYSNSYMNYFPIIADSKESFHEILMDKLKTIFDRTSILNIISRYVSDLPVGNTDPELNNILVYERMRIGNDHSIIDDEIDSLRILYICGIIVDAYSFFLCDTWDYVNHIPKLWENMIFKEYELFTIDEYFENVENIVSEKGYV